MKITLAVVVAVLFSTLAFAQDQDVAAAARANKTKQQAQTPATPAKPTTAAKPEQPKDDAIYHPTPEMIAAAKQLLLKLQQLSNGGVPTKDLDEAYAAVSLEGTTDKEHNLLLQINMLTLKMTAEVSGLSPACIGDVNRALRSGVWHGTPESCEEKKK
jgi:hypothetical protein